MDRLLSGTVPPPYVAASGPQHWLVKRVGARRLALRRLGFGGAPFFGPMSRRDRDPLDFAEMGRLAMRLRDLGFAFSAGRDWAPAEMVRFLRDEGHVDGAFAEIAWGAGGRWEVRPL